MAGKFRGMLIFVTLTLLSPPTKINDTCRHAQAQEVGVVDFMTDRPAEQDTRSYSDRVSGSKYELTRIDKNRADVSSSLLSTS